MTDPTATRLSVIRADLASGLPSPDALGADRRFLLGVVDQLAGELDRARVGTLRRRTVVLLLAFSGVSAALASVLAEYLPVPGTAWFASFAVYGLVLAAVGGAALGACLRRFLNRLITEENTRD